MIASVRLQEPPGQVEVHHEYAEDGTKATNTHGNLDGFETSLLVQHGASKWNIGYPQPGRQTIRWDKI